MNALADIFDSRKAAASERSQEELNAEKQLKDYLAASTLPGGADPLEWWKSPGAAMHPVLAVLARRYLTINATSVSSERVFSVAGNVVTKRRSCMNPDTVNRMVFLACNLRK